MIHQSQNKQYNNNKYIRHFGIVMFGPTFMTQLCIEFHIAKSIDFFVCIALTSIMTTQTSYICTFIIPKLRRQWHNQQVLPFEFSGSFHFYEGLMLQLYLSNDKLQYLSKLVEVKRAEIVAMNFKWNICKKFGDIFPFIITRTPVEKALSRQHMPLSWGYDETMGRIRCAMYNTVLSGKWYNPWEKLLDKQFIFRRNLNA